MSWVVITIVGGIGISVILNLLVHLIFRLTGGHMDDE